MRVHFKSYAGSREIVRRAYRIAPPLVVIVVVTIALAGIVSSCAPAPYRVEPMTVEGTISVQGNEPFTAVILQTSERNYYVLSLSPEMRARLSAPTIRKVTGYLYLDQWNGKDFAHLDVIQIAPPDDA
jgi:hypothetical protein